MKNPFDFMKQLFSNKKETVSESFDADETFIDISDDAFIDVENVKIAASGKPPVSMKN